MAEDSEDEDYTFGIKPPPLYITIKEILQEYPDGQIFKEIIQNADDARATEVKFFLDYRHIQTVAPSLSSCPDLELFEGPALLAYNDAGFKKNDWKSIQRPKRSEKARDCMKVGKFGSGFNSVYHITDLPVILSGERYAFMDPLQIVWPGETGRWWKLSELSGKPDALAGVLGFCNFSPDCYNFSNKTLFRFPLRKQWSKLSDVNYTLTKLWNTLEALRKEAKYLLLFLRSVQTIGVYKITHSGEEKVFSVSITEKDWQGRHEKLRHFEEEIKYRLLDMQLAHKMRDVVSFTNQFTVVVAEQGMAEREYEWLVVQQVGSTSEEVLDMVKLFNDRKESVLPWVGTAVELGEPQELKSGRIFCFLPMPFEKLSPLPVHVNGSFAVSKDRRSLKWPTVERQTDPGALWNELLTKFCLSSCYKQLLVSLTLKKAISPSMSYAAWPDPSVVKESEWKGLLTPLFSTLLHEQVFYSKVEGGQWVTLGEAWLTPEDGLPETVTNCLLACNVKLVHTNSLMWNVFHFCSNSLITSSSLNSKCISPKIVTEVFKLVPACYKNLKRYQKLELLSYCMEVREYSQLNMLELLPLANDTFVQFDQGSIAEKVYLCSPKFPSSLLPFLEHCLVDIVSNDNLQTHFKSLAESGCTQVCEMTLRSVASLLPQSIKKGWSVDQYKFFWNWVQPYDLSNFNGCPVVPILCDSHRIVSVKLSSRKARAVLITSRLNPCLLDALKKVGVMLARQDELHFLQHDKILNYINPFTPEGVLSIASFSEMVSFTITESYALQMFFASLDITTPSNVTILCRMPIFQTLQHENASLFSIDGVADGKSFALAENSSSFSINSKFLSLQPLVLAQRGNNTALLSQMSNLQKVCLITMHDYICDYVFPLIRVGRFPDDKLNGFMMEIMQLLHVFHTAVRKKVLAKMRTVPFLLNSKNSLKSPTELFDYNCDTVTSLYKGEPVFPLAPFNAKKYSTLLRSAGLKSEQDVTALNIYEIVETIKCKGASPQNNGTTNYARACAVMKFLSSKPSLLDNRYNLFSTLFEGLVDLDHTVSWLPVCSAPPLGYPKCLSWKGSSYPNCLTSQQVGILPLVSPLPLITGSQLLFLQDATENKLTTALKPPNYVIAEAVVRHFEEVIGKFTKFDPEDNEKIVNCTYMYLNSIVHNIHCRIIFKRLMKRKWIWLDKKCDYLRSSNVALNSNPSFISSLEPFIYTLPHNYAKFYDLFEILGVPREISAQQIVSVLTMIKENVTGNIPPFRLWRMVHDILEWVAIQKDTLQCSKLLIPVKSEKAYPVLKFVDEVAYVDSHVLMLAATHQHKMCPIVHSSIPIDVVIKLGVKPLSKHLGIAGELPQDVGQQESLIQRLKNILKDYKDGLTIIKELLQNADDAEATELNIIYDSRNHSSQYLLFPGMAKAHGPALIVHNDQTFTDDDFENITKLAGATKEDKPLKIGKFGIGFCSVYHITDVPSFISGEWLYIFDPTLKHLDNIVQNAAQPGQKVQCTSPLLSGSQQLDPYQSIFNYVPGRPYLGTIFRLPFRTTRSEVSEKCYNRNDIDSLKDQLAQEGSKLLLFLRNVRKITFSEFRQGDRIPQQLIVIHKSSDICIMPGVNHINLKAKGSTFVKSEEWIVSNYSKSTASTNYQSAAVACKLEPNGLLYKVSRVNGEIFCSLPLGSQSGLPVHVSANFAVTTNRREIWSSSSRHPEKEVRWNRELMNNAIPRAYSQLLISLKEMNSSENSNLDYCFHSLWPLRAQLQAINPWNIFIGELYKLISAKALFFSQSQKQWLYLSQCKFISNEIFISLSPTCKPPKSVMRVLELLNQPIIDLPADFHHHLNNLTFIRETEFISFFFSNITSLSSDIDTRNEIIVLILEFYSWNVERGSNISELKHLLVSVACIPCTPHSQLKLCKDLVDSSAPIARLFEPHDSLFPITMLCNNLPAMRAMQALGLQTDSVSYGLLAYSAKRIQKLYFRHRERAYDKILLILKCVEKNHDSKSGSDLLKNIPFLPVMSPPKDYILPWYGKQDCLLAPCNLMSGTKLPSLVGSQTAILDISVIKTQTYDRIPSYLLSDIGVKTQPLVATVIEQLICLTKIRPELAILEAIGSMYRVICSFLEDSLKEQAETNTLRLSSSYKHVHVDLTKLKCLPCVWTGRQFVEPSYVAKNWKCDGPILYPVPEALRFRSVLRKALGCKDSFTAVDLFKGLSLLHKPDSPEPLPDQCQLLVREIIAELDKFPIEKFEEFSNRENVMIPDTNFILQRVNDLVFNDVEWCSDSNDYKIANSCISPSLAEKLGITFIRRKTLQEYERVYHGGKNFGQRENLTRRIANILREYPFDVTFIKEILQNADDAKATKLCVILDTRQLVSEKTKMISDNWKELQGPALLVWNNRTFTEKDLQGIQDLGIGGKRGDSETIGQFGIGFNVVYHVTDCPSFISCVNGESLLCVFDPLCRYVPGANALHPGGQYNTNEKFWEDFSAIKPGYYIDEINGCPEDMQRELQNGTLFRLPIRKKIDKKETTNNNIFTESMLSLLTHTSLLEHVKQWIIDIKLSLLFLKHLTNIQFYMIDGRHSQESMTLLASYSATLSQEAIEKRAKLESYTSSFQQGCTPQVIMYPLTITSVIRDFKHDPSTNLQIVSAKCRSQNECWLVQEGVGDIFCLKQHWKFVPEFKPRHGLAASLQPKQSTSGQLFCFLPLPLSSHMPVHINGHFMLAATRRGLWTSTDSDHPDDNTKWNYNLLQAIASSYAHFLLNAIPHYVKKHYLDRESAVLELKNYYKIFPTKYCYGLMKQVADNVLKKLHQRNAKLLCSVKHSQDSSSYLTKWAPLIEEGKRENQSYMLFAPYKEKLFENEQEKKEYDKKMLLHTKLRCLLEDIGININSVPRFIWKAFKLVECELPIADGRQVFHFCKQFPQKIGRLPCSIEQTSIKSIKNFTLLLAHMCIQHEGRLQFPADDCVGAPFLFTADGCLCVFAENRKVLLSNYFYLFSHSGCWFAHPSLVEMNIDPAYFYQSDEESFGFTGEIFMRTIPSSLFQTRTKESYQDVLSRGVLSQIWECITNDPVFSCHLISILSKWALIPSLKNQLFLYNSKSLLPVNVSSVEFEDTDTSPQSKLLLCTFGILEKLQMPFLDTAITNSDCLKSLCPSIFNPETILKNLTHLHQVHPIQLENTQLIGILFEYFSEVAFGSKNDRSYRDCICSLPLFQNIDGKLTSLTQKKVFVWPHNVEQVGLSSWLPSDVVFLTKKGEWTKLGAAQGVFGIRDITAVQLYMQYIFPRFNLLSKSDRYKHLKHVRDEISRRQFYGNNPFEAFPCVENEHGDLGYIADYCDPDVHLFHTFSSHFTFPHKNYHQSKWLEFFRDFGLQQEVSMCKFEKLARLVENGNHPELHQASADLFEYLLYTLCKVNWRLDNIPGAEDWRKDRSFLRRVFDISFVMAENLPQLNWIVPQCAASKKIEKGGTTYHLTVLNGAAISDVADTVWTVRPIVSLPRKYCYTNIVLHYIGTSSLLSDMGLVMEPCVSDVVKNIQNIATVSELINLSLFDKYTIEIGEDQSLLRVMSRNFGKLSKIEAELRIQECQSLASMKCIPVFAGNFSQQNWFILVEPQCVIVSSTAQEFQPFLNPLPKDLITFMSDVLEHIGVKHELDFEHCRYALEKMHQCSSDHKQVDVNTQPILEKLLKRMYTIMQDQSSIANITTATLYLPSIHLRLMPSNCLLYCDQQRYQHCVYTVFGSSNVSVLWLPDSVISENFCKLLPKKVRPKPLSSCEERILSRNVETKTNPVTEELQKALQNERSVSVLEMILHQSTDIEKSQLLLEYFKRVLYGAKVVAAPKLTIALTFKSVKASEANVEIAKCAVDYFIDESVSVHDRSTIYIDDSISDVSTAMFNVQMPMANHILMIASLDSHEKLQYRISFLLKAKNEKDFKSVLNLCNIREGHSHSLCASAIIPKVGLPVPENWHQKLDQNMRNIFRPDEWVAFETQSEPHVYIFTQIVCPDVNKEGRMPDDIYRHQYFILDPDEDEPLSVSIQLLYKFRRSSPSQAVVLHDGNGDETVTQSDTEPLSQQYKDEIMQILDGLKKYKHEEQRRIIRRLFLQWHPDKNLDNVTLAHDVFTFLNGELERRHLATTPSVDEWNREASSHRQASEQNPPSNEYFEDHAEPDIDQAWRWLEQARLDKQALDILLSTANDRLSGHVCFLAHEVTEKALKAGMYAVHGDIQAHLKKHQLYPLSNSIVCKLSVDSSSQITHTVSVLENYYNETRWPNRWPGSSLPADHFTPTEAQNAQDMAASVIETIENLIRGNS